MSREEYWDITDERGNPTGRTYRRGDTYREPGFYHVVSTVCVHRGSGADLELLLTKRSATKDLPLTWEFPGGSVLAGESWADGAARELAEETGLVIPAAAMHKVGRHREAATLIDLYAVPLSRAQPPAQLTPDPAEIADTAWVSPRELHDRLAAGLLAWPWRDRIAALWPQLAEIIGADPRLG